MVGLGGGYLSRLSTCNNREYQSIPELKKILDIVENFMPQTVKLGFNLVVIIWIQIEGKGGQGVGIWGKPGERAGKRGACWWP